MGSVFLATQKRLNRPVAIKVLHPHLVPNAAMRSRFEREARIVARLRHPSIVTIHDFGVLPSAHAYLVMEYINGETLRLMILGGPVDYRRALSIVRPVGDAVEMAHRAGVVHRDLKPENVMLVRDADNAQSTPRVLDFGLARINEPMSGDNTSHGSSSHGIGFVGTLLYVAPEMLSGAAADARSDQYSLAVMTYELLSGSHPLAGAMDLAAVVRGHTEGELPSLATRVPFMPEAVSAAVHRALSKDPNERFPTVGAFMQALG
jgi:serine/threonine-protein kinase